jgi:hypothetical protein
VLLTKAVIFLFIICGFWPTDLHRSGQNCCSVRKIQTVFIRLTIAEKLYMPLREGCNMDRIFHLIRRDTHTVFNVIFMN